MTNRRNYHKRTAKDVRADGRYVRLLEHMLDCPAWQSLDSNSRCLYAELARRYRGPNSNNGKIPYSVREAATALAIGKSTAQRCFEKLIDRGFTKIGKRSGFIMKGRAATEWLLTEFPDDSTASTGIASKDFMKWTADLNHSPAARKKPTALDRLRTAWKAATADERAEFLNSFHSPTSGPHSPTSGTQVYPQRDRVAEEQLLRTCSGTVSPESNAPQSRHRDTTHLPGESDSLLPKEPPREARSPHSAVASGAADTRSQLESGWALGADTKANRRSWRRA